MMNRSSDHCSCVADCIVSTQVDVSLPDQAVFSCQCERPCSEHCLFLAAESTTTPLCTKGKSLAKNRTCLAFTKVTTTPLARQKGVLFCMRFTRQEDT